MAVILFGSVYSQTQISGSVMDSDSMEAIPGVNVIIDGTNIGTVTDFDGNFVINTSQGAPLTLIVSYMGYSAERVDVTSASQNINVMLSAGQNLEEVIISASRSAQKVTDAPASVSVISSRQIENSAQVAEPSRILVSVPGVQIQQQTANSLNVEMRGCEKTKQLVGNVQSATEKDFETEYLAPIISIKIVAEVDEAIAHINKYSSQHTESIITENHDHAQRFLREVDSSSVMVNASTRFADGFEYGLGAEIGISTDKLHARGPVGLEGLTSQKFIVLGDGHIRQ